MDKSCIHKNYSRHDDSYFDPNNEQDLEVKVQHKGKRYCKTAILDADKRQSAIQEEDKLYKQKAHLMLDILGIFEGKKKQT